MRIGGEEFRNILFIFLIEVIICYDGVRGWVFLDVGLRVRKDCIIGRENVYLNLNSIILVYILIHPQTIYNCQFPKISNKIYYFS
jgi:hypothetical protein